VLRFVLTLWPLALAAGLFALARVAPEATEALYTRRVYPVVAAAVAWPARLWQATVGVGSVAEWGLLALLCFACVRAVVIWRSSEHAFSDLTLGTLRGASVAVLVFVLVWGLNHARRPLHATLGFGAPTSASAAPGAPPEVAAELQALARTLGRLAAGARAELTEDTHGVVVAPADYGARAAAAWRRAALQRPVLVGPEARVVEPLASTLLIAGRVSGVFSPFTGEAHVARGLPAVARGFSACHELAHGRGYAREDEANGLAFLVGVESGDPYLVLSSTALGLVHVMGALGRVDPERFAATVAELDAGLLRDLAAQRAFWTQERSQLVQGFGRVATATNDAYLRSMGTRDGVLSYGRMVDLVLGWWRLQPASQDGGDGH
jgi:hypothetical protein